MQNQIENMPFQFCHCGHCSKIQFPSQPESEEEIEMACSLIDFTSSNKTAANEVTVKGTK